MLMLANETELKFWKDFGDKVFETRKRRGWTQSDLAFHIGISRCQIANIEAGRSRVDAYKLHMIAEALDSIPTPPQPAATPDEIGGGG